VNARRLIALAVLVLLAHAGLLQALCTGGAGRAAGTSNAHVRGFVRLLRVADAGPATLAASAGPVAPSPAPASSTRRDANPPAAVSTATAQDASAAPAQGAALYRPGTALDAPVRPRSAPDLSRLSDLPWSGLPLRLRLFIDAEGVVVDILVLQSAEAQEVVERVREMFLATSFTAGTENGRAVPCFKDIELNVGARS
jgi:hypothetical protein